jgi:signal transduction histidine kinase
MRSVMENLIGNAWKFSGREETAEILVGGSPLRGEYYVRDNGCRLRHGLRHRLFETFQRLHGADEFPPAPGSVSPRSRGRSCGRAGGSGRNPRRGRAPPFFFTLPPAGWAA